jgi:SAM-dependent methyltransferase
MVNAFGLETPQMKAILADTQIEEAVKEMLGSVLGYLGLPEDRGLTIIEETLEGARTLPVITDYEREIHQVLEREGLTKAFPEKLFERTQLMYQQIAPYLLQGSVLDLGCGDGEVGELAAADGFNVTLSDVFRHQNIKKTGLEFHLFEQGKSVPLVENNQFDNTLNLYVYHHSDNPLGTLLEAKRLTKPGGRIIVLESVYGIDGTELSSEQQETAKSFVHLSHNQQRLTNIFFDHFWNRVLMYDENPKNKINVPYNFNTPQGWKEIFEQHGLKQEELVHLGIDQPTVPEYHTLHVLRVQ